MAMEIWEWTSQQLTCKLNFLQAKFQKFLFGYLEVVVAPANRISKLLYGDLEWTSQPTIPFWIS